MFKFQNKRLELGLKVPFEIKNKITLVRTLILKIEHVRLLRFRLILNINLEQGSI
jgi:hypothetical protein